MANQAHWKTCEQLGQILGVSKSKVNNHYNLLKEHATAILAEDPDAIEKGKEIVGAKEKRGIYDDIKLAFWFIEQAGGLSRAKKVFQIATATMEAAELED